MSVKAMLLRDLANAAASHPRIEQAVTAAIRTVLPDVIDGILREQYRGEEVRFYVARNPSSHRRDRDAAIRAEYTGRNIKELARKYSLSVSQVFRIVATR